ncbi:unnamed protein product [Spirodela intermedia]|uniref:Uncharacterized protein n=1 Tax=Spirodela intermedia TaxID=51605 RepID=A0A7I8IWX2_SPIIN|nr:unnamed protein product [Spirodela intermedia]CAA6661480.1 unnamed protein product [Spirodela intermedia]
MATVGEREKRGFMATVGERRRRFVTVRR